MAPCPGDLTCASAAACRTICIGTGDCAGGYDCTAGVCHGTCPGNPKPEICNGYDDDCDLVVDNGVCAAGSTCCPTQLACRNLATDLNNCTSCGNVCDPVAADTCGATGCLCGTNPPCAAGTYCAAGGLCPMCNTTARCGPTCVSCGAGVCKLDGSGCVQCNVDADCGPGSYCQAGACMVKLATGTACTGANQCASSFCSRAFDGTPVAYCTAAPCTGCRGGDNTGACVNVPAGMNPNGFCVAGASVICEPGTCDGAGACALPTAAVDCGSTCVAGQLTLRTCDGAGTCVSVSSSCGGFGCAAANSCKAACSVDGDCAPRSFCNATCVAQLATGQPCTRDGQCLSGVCAGGTTCAIGAIGAACTDATHCSSGFCADGVCCSTACAGPCDVCSQALGATADGTCTPAPAGYGGTCGAYVCPGGVTDCGASLCVADDGCAPGYYCGADQACHPQKTDGAACSTIAGADCLTDGCRACGSAGGCVDGVCCKSVCAGPCSTCSASPGVCLRAPKGDQGRPGCGAYLCNGSAANCPLTCSGDADCAPPAGHCVGGACVGLFARGEPCVSSAECESHNCVDHVCCNSSCTGDCFACDLPGSIGVCTQMVHGVDWRRRCPGTGLCKASCGADALCAFPDEARACHPPGCVTAVLLHRAMSCDGFGACAERGALDCDPFACRGATCPGTCVDSSYCANPNLCVNQSCGLNRVIGAACSANSDCTSGFCADGVCCQTACASKCMACNLPGSVGTCAVGENADPHGDCSGEGLCAGKCAKDATCTWPATEQRCDTCKACDGNGHCDQPLPSGDDAACMTVSCGALSTECMTFRDLTAMRCAGVGLCAAPNDPVTCTQIVPKDDGVACQAGACKAGLCVTGLKPGLTDKSSACAIGGRPAPAALWLVLAALAGLVARRRRDQGSERGALK
jgi:hypothetical protein